MSDAGASRSQDVLRTTAALFSLTHSIDSSASGSSTTRVLETCAPVIDHFDVMWIRNDLAIAQHRAGDDQACLVTLEPLASSCDAPPGEFIGYEPAHGDLLARIAKATRTNAKLCGFVEKPAKELDVKQRRARVARWFVTAWRPGGAFCGGRRG